MKAGPLPKGWPTGIQYLTRYSYAKSLSPETLMPPSTPADVLKAPNGPSPLVRISAISDSSHPANGQYGLVATKHLPPGSLVVLYLGWVHGEADTDPTSDYDLSLDREQGIGVDASHMGNESRFTNDYRGIAPKPNAEFRDIWVETSQGCIEKTMAIFVLGAGKGGSRAKGIQKNEEILVNYGKGFWGERRKQEELEQLGAAQ